MKSLIGIVSEAKAQAEQAAEANKVLTEELTAAKEDATVSSTAASSELEVSNPIRHSGQGHLAGPSIVLEKGM